MLEVDAEPVGGDSTQDDRGPELNVKRRRTPAADLALEPLVRYIAPGVGAAPQRGQQALAEEAIEPAGDDGVIRQHFQVDRIDLARVTPQPWAIRRAHRATLGVDRLPGPLEVQVELGAAPKRRFARAGGRVPLDGQAEEAVHELRVADAVAFDQVVDVRLRAEALQDVKVEGGVVHRDDQVVMGGQEGRHVPTCEK